jgi:hypothetical protein
MISVKEKPEIIHDAGVTTTPKFIVDEIVSKSLQGVINGKTPEQIKSLHFADICCGSGVFLVGMYQYIVDYVINWYVKDGPENHKNQIYQGAGNTWYLALVEKNPPRTVRSFTIGFMN